MTSTENLAQGVLNRDRRALARLLTRVENREPAAAEALRELYPHTGRAATVGVTGQPGAGKSTLVFALATELRRRGSTAGILAIDPSSPFTRGAILGDRIRMQELTSDSGVFIRSMATRGAMGGLAAGTIDAMAVLDAFGMDYVIVETVGAGQDEVDVVRAAQTVLVVEIPGTGDSIQSLKAGMLEIADIFVVNKADREGADAVVANLRQMMSLQLGKQRRPSIVKTVAVEQKGIVELADAIREHQQYLRESGKLGEREGERARFQLLALAREKLSERLTQEAAFDALMQQVQQRTIDPHTAAERLVDQVMRGCD